MAAKFGLLVIGAYLLGSVPMAYLVARWSRGVDLRQYGSGSVGATNIARLTSKKTAAVVGLFDLAKGLVMVWVAQLIGLGITEQAAVGLAAIIGHNWSVFLRFSGGRGILTTLGIAIFLPSTNGLVPWEAIVGLTITAIGVFALHNLPLGVFVGMSSVPLVSWGVGEPLPLTLGFLAMFLIIVIKRLAVPRATIAASLSTRQLLVNRLLFDRDIRDREAWIHRVPGEVAQPNSNKSKGKVNP